MGTLTVQGTKSVCFTRCDVCIIAIACDTFQNILYLWLRLFLCFYLDGLGTSESVFTFFFSILVVYTAAPTLYIQAQEARPATGHQHIKRKDTCTLH